MTTRRLKESDYIIAWLLFTVIATVGGAIAGFIAGATLGALLGLMEASEQTIMYVCAAAGYAVALPVSYFTFRLVVRHRIVGKLQVSLPEDHPSTTTE